jgi:preprotein translocase subunit SecE
LANVNPFKFVQEVRQEVAKVTWPTRNETWVTTIAVLIMVTLASIFFMLSDQLMGWIVSLILGIGR